MQEQKHNTFESYFRENHSPKISELRVRCILNTEQRTCVVSEKKNREKKKKTRKV